MQDTATTLARKPNPLVAIWEKPLVQAFLNDPVTLVSGVFIAVIFLAVIFAPLVSPHDPKEVQISLRHRIRWWRFGPEDCSIPLPGT